MRNVYWVYMVTNASRTALYVGVTNDLERRLYEHRAKTAKGFTEKYNCDRLIYFEEAGSIHDAIARKKQIKKWSRAKKEALVDMMNLSREDLSTPPLASVEMTGQENSL